MTTTIWKKIAIGFALLVVLIWCIGELLLLSDARTKNEPVSSALEATSSVTDTKTPLQVTEVMGVEGKMNLSEVAVSAAPVLESKMTAASATETKQTIAVQFVVEHATTSYRVLEGSTVLDLMRQASSSNVFTFTGKEYSGLGTLIIAINNKASNQDQNDLYWIYSVNGKKATIGVSQYLLREGDVVSWSYEPSTM